MAFVETERTRTEAITGAVVAAVMDRQREVSEQRWRIAGGIALRVILLAVCGYVLWRVRTILTTVIVAGVLASAAGALVEPLMRYRLPFLKPKVQRSLAALFVFAMMFAALAATVHFMIGPFAQEWTQLRLNWPHYQVSLMAQAVQAKAWFANLPPDVKNLLNGMKENHDVPSVSAWLGNILAATLSWASHIVELILIPVLAFYFTVDGRALRSELLFFVPKGRLRSTMAILNESGAIMRAYVVAQFWLAAIAGVTVGFGLYLLGMPYALILGIIAGITRAIPIIGPLLGGIPVVALSFLYGAQQHNPYLWLWVATFFTVLHVVESKIVMPHFLGHRLHLHAVVILIALLIGGEFFGLMGMFLAAPLAALARVLIAHFLVLPRRRAEREAVATAADPESRTAAQGTLRLTTIEVSGGRTLRLERALRADATRRLPPDAA